MRARVGLLQISVAAISPCGRVGCGRGDVVQAPGEALLSGDVYAKSAFRRRKLFVGIWALRGNLLKPTVQRGCLDLAEFF